MKVTPYCRRSSPTGESVPPTLTNPGSVQKTYLHGRCKISSPRVFLVEFNDKKSSRPDLTSSLPVRQSFPLSSPPPYPVLDATLSLRLPYASRGPKTSGQEDLNRLSGPQSRGRTDEGGERPKVL